MTTTMQLIAKQTVGAGGAASVTFSNIPQTFTDLKVVMSYRTNRAQIYDQLRVRFNGDTASNYSFKALFGNGASVDWDQATTTSLQLAIGQGNSATASTFSNGDFYLPNYRASTSKSVSSDLVGENNATTAYASLYAGLWTGTAAINTILMYPESGGLFNEFSEFWLYGISNSTTQNTSVPYASGGDVITTDGSYWYHAFKYSGSFTPLKNLTADVLVVAGGGGGGTGTQPGAGGGGAGGLRSTVTATGGGGTIETALALLANTSYVATIGAGGVGGSSSTTQIGVNGGNSIFSTITSIGGGGGAGSNNTDTVTSQTGGSGSGGARPATGNTSMAGGSGTTNQGYAGGNGRHQAGVRSTGGGGGGAGAVGQNGGDTSTPAGGNGVQITALATPTSTGANSGYYAGGGGASSDAGAGFGTGGLGGGGAGAGSGNGNAGTANTGGGGGAANNPNTNLGGNGGSGIIIVRYPIL
jgi:hypothetical protein